MIRKPSRMLMPGCASGSSNSMGAGVVVAVVGGVGMLSSELLSSAMIASYGVSVVIDDVRC